MNINKFNNKKKINKEIYSRKKKLKKLKKKGFLFLNSFKNKNFSKNIYNIYNKKTKIELKILNIKVKVSGRIISKRIIGRSSFYVIQDFKGKIQIYFNKNFLKKNKNEKLNFKYLDIGDILGIKGKLFKTNTGELTIRCSKIYLLTKSIRPLPNKFHGLINKEIKYRQRYLDLISNKKTRNIFKIRSKIIMEIRKFMIKNDFLEVETPILQNLPGGAEARPFITYHNLFKKNKFLRISPELFLKKLVVGGFEKIFEISKNFRNEGFSSCHHPEFTMMELYIAYSDYFDLIKIIEKLFLILTKKICKKNIIKYKNYLLDFSKPFKRMTMIEAILNYNKEINIKKLNNINLASNFAKSLGIKINSNYGLGKIQTKIFEFTVCKNLIQPTFITSYPVEVSPLARSNNNNFFYSDRFELFISGYEIGNGFSELNDSKEQLNRFIKQKKNNKYKISYDKDYITSLEYGLPPTAGLGLGLDRLIMLLTNQKNIRDVILFPMIRDND